jgi:hypothetical protein
LALLLPVLAAVSGWLLQWFLRFPPGSLGASLTASMLFLPPLAEIVPVPIAIIRLVRNASLRSIVTLALTALGAAFLLLGVLLAFALFVQ